MTTMAAAAKLSCRRSSRRSSQSRGRSLRERPWRFARRSTCRRKDNVDEDGDFVSLIVNGEVITQNEMIFNRGKVFMVDLQPGENQVEIQGLRDGGGGITLEVNVAGVGNVNNEPIPEGSTASFIINRQQ